MNALSLESLVLRNGSAPMEAVCAEACALHRGKDFVGASGNARMQVGDKSNKLGHQVNLVQSWVRMCCLLLLLFWMTPNAYSQSLDTLRGVAMLSEYSIPYTLISKIPEGTEAEQVPVIMFLHGAGERGGDNTLQITVGLPALIASLEALHMPCYMIYAPQCPADQKWVDTDWTALHHQMGPQLNPPLAAAMAQLHLLLADDPRYDPARIYLTGISMGGFGAWELLTRYPNRFAAGIPICGGGDPAFAQPLTQTPIWAFHGKKDKLVKVARTTEMIDAIVQVGGHPKLTLYDEIGHLCWNTVYKDHAVIQWLISQHRDAR